ncbi:hypothetical protein AAIR98_000042 [Elusimicrobium simillimum]|uniref:hypothetical protein n=1 Tax=Elusimicrobium simillimum TaxID=3143438 RepID=UPI003C6EDE9A
MRKYTILFLLVLSVVFYCACNKEASTDFVQPEITAENKAQFKETLNFAKLGNPDFQI